MCFGFNTLMSVQHTGVRLSQSFIFYFIIFSFNGVPVCTCMSVSLDASVWNTCVPLWLCTTVILIPQKAKTKKKQVFNASGPKYQFVVDWEWFLLNVFDFCDIPLDWTWGHDTMNEKSRLQYYQVPDLCQILSQQRHCLSLELLHGLSVKSA